MKKLVIVVLFFLTTYILIANVNDPNSLVIQRVQIKGNDACTWIQNTGIFNFNSASYVAGLFWPCDIFSSYCYSSGLCASGIINGKLGQFVCSFRGELVPGYIANNSLQTNPDYKIYFVKSTDNESTNPDYANWYKMVPYGAPYQDLNNNYIFDVGIINLDSPVRYRQYLFV